ncbi:MAG TPA: SRPBCC family protein [Vicinamibacterales bacterium]|jgi:uncharacterized membrane protein|nr:SRPBCC family protein [Vicinamibacterales bacterium]
MSTSVNAARYRSSDANLGRWVSLAAATALVAYGVRRRGPATALALAAATPLAYRGLKGGWPRLGGGDVRPPSRAGRLGVQIRETIHIEQPVGEVYHFWRRLSNLPRFMSHLEAVSELDDCRSHWVGKAIGPSQPEWDVHIINDVSDSVIAWRSLPGSDLLTFGSVTFTKTRIGRITQVALHLHYQPTRRVDEAWITRSFGSDPSQSIREDLRRLKRLVETGEVSGPPASTR